MMYDCDKLYVFFFFGLGMCDDDEICIYNWFFLSFKYLIFFICEKRTNKRRKRQNKKEKIKNHNKRRQRSWKRRDFIRSENN